eukprot:7789914-Prorocentrum_lima.AAC.1
MKDQPDWEGLSATSPDIRSTICLLKMSSRDEVYKLLNMWIWGSHVFKGNTIRAKADRPPEQRKANAKIYLLT